MEFKKFFEFQLKEVLNCSLNSKTSLYLQTVIFQLLFNKKYLLADFNLRTFYCVCIVYIMFSIFVEHTSFSTHLLILSIFIYFIYFFYLFPCSILKWKCILNLILDNHKLTLMCFLWWLKNSVVYPNFCHCKKQALKSVWYLIYI